jgi:hypothetical protein
VDALVIDGRSEAMMLNWLLDDARSKNNEHTEVRDDLWRKAKHTIFGSMLCSDLSMPFGKTNGAKANSLGRLFVWPPLIFVRGRKLVLRANAIRFS